MEATKQRINYNRTITLEWEAAEAIVGLNYFTNRIFALDSAVTSIKPQKMFSLRGGFLTYAMRMTAMCYNKNCTFVLCGSPDGIWTLTPLSARWYR